MSDLRRSSPNGLRPFDNGRRQRRAVAGAARQRQDQQCDHVGNRGEELVGDLLHGEEKARKPAPIRAWIAADRIRERAACRAISQEADSDGEDEGQYHRRSPEAQGSPKPKTSEPPRTPAGIQLPKMSAPSPMKPATPGHALPIDACLNQYQEGTGQTGKHAGDDHPVVLER